VGPRYEKAFRDFLWGRLATGDFGENALKVGPYWTRGGVQVEIDAVVLTDDGVAIAVGECKWQQKVSGTELRTKLLKAARALSNALVEPEVIVCARDEVTDARGIQAVTASDIFV
jgi:sulfur transfer complex TusBCD TusB component (DsrH family)